VSDIAVRRLGAQRLVGEPLAGPVEVVRWLGAVQSQDYGAATWALALRSRPTTGLELDRIFNAGLILRTHILRPTWHFALPEDIRWLAELTGPRVRRSLAGRYRQLEIDESLIARSNAAVAAALRGGRYLTRPEIGDVLVSAGIQPQGQRLPHLIMAAELQGLITSGPRRGKEFTFALLDERAPNARRLDREDALRELVLRFFRSHGPAQLGDFTWWSGLATAEARTGLEAAGAALEREVVDGKMYWVGSDVATPRLASPTAHLLPNFDEYTVAYRDRDQLYVDGPFDRSVFSFGSVLANVVTVDGLVRGAWRRTFASRRVRLELRLLRDLHLTEQRAVDTAGQKLAQFLGTSVDLVW
jgi:hypothetical protein